MGTGLATTITWYGRARVDVRAPGGKTRVSNPSCANPQSPRTTDALADAMRG